MTLHLVKLCVGVNSPEALKERQEKNYALWQASHPEASREAYLPFHITRRKPRQVDALLEGGSLYWVIGGFIQARQTLRDFTVFEHEEQPSHCRISFDSELIPVMPAPRRPFQGWRYLKPEEAPQDKQLTDQSGEEEGIAILHQKLKHLGAW